MAQPGTGGASGVDTQLQNQSMRVERKHFTFDLRENPRGRFLRIIEEVNGRRDAIIIPVTGLEDFRDQTERNYQVQQDSHTKTVAFGWYAARLDEKPGAVWLRAISCLYFFSPLVIWSMAVWACSLTVGSVSRSNTERAFVPSISPHSPSE